MLAVIAKTYLIFTVLLGGAIHCFSQTAADNNPMSRPGAFEKDEHPRSIRDSLEKMRIEKEKKDFDRMVERGEEALRIAAELETSLTNNGRLTEKEKAKLVSVEKLAKQIRNDLGGGDDEDMDKPTEGLSVNILESVRRLRSSTEDLYKELKKTTRFTISATAIYSSNTVLRLARFMRIAQ